MNKLILAHSFSHRDRQEGLHHRRTSLEANLRHEFLAMLFNHVAEGGMHERIRQVRDAGEIKDDRLRVVPNAFHLEHAEPVADVTVCEEIAEFGHHLEFEFHVGKIGK